MQKTSLNTLQEYKEQGRRFACITSYDASFARLCCAAGVPLLLVGDSLGMVLQGHDSTLPVTMGDMIYHTRCVRRGNNGALLMTDLPFAACATPAQAIKNSAALMRAGAQVVKLEGGRAQAETVRALAQCGIPCCGHLGLTPQSIHQFGGFRVQGRQADAAQRLREDAQILEQAGMRLLVLECIPAPLATEISQSLTIPVIGIGAGPGTDGQVLVLHDLLGLHPQPPRFVKNFLAQGGDLQGAVSAFVQAVSDGSFPAPEHCYTDTP